MARAGAGPILLLASGSPRRHELLRKAGFRFEVVRPLVDERSDSQLTVGELTTWNAMRKGISVARENPAAVVLAADTLVALDGEIIGKPADSVDALRILRRLNGRTHDVCTGVFVGSRRDFEFSLFQEISQVRFKRLTDKELRDYLSSINPLDKAGAYAAQENGGKIIAGIDGSRSNVVGLPMERTVLALEAFGIRRTIA